MTRGETVYVRGELHLTLETIAEIYSVDVAWLRSAYEIGLLGPGQQVRRQVCLAAAVLDRVATIVRLRHVVGVRVDDIRRALAQIESAPPAG